MAKHTTSHTSSPLSAETHSKLFVYLHVPYLQVFYTKLEKVSRLLLPCTDRGWRNSQSGSGYHTQTVFANCSWTLPSKMNKSMPLFFSSAAGTQSSVVCSFNSQKQSTLHWAPTWCFRNTMADLGEGNAVGGVDIFK